MSFPFLLIGYVARRPRSEPAPEPQLLVAPRWARGIDHSQFNAKRCSACGVVKLKANFHKSRQSKDRLHHACIACHYETKKVSLLSP